MSGAAGAAAAGSQAFALTADWTTVFLGGQLKRKQKISGRMADILGDLYLMSATLSRGTRTLVSG